MTTNQKASEHDVLTQDNAEKRARRISNCAYEIHLELTKGSPTYLGKVTITFSDTGEGQLDVNFRCQTITQMTLNGREINPEFEGRNLLLQNADLEENNKLEINYINEYDHGGDGFHQFLDPEDGEEYLYTNFEPFDAHRLFPCFDQPDLKATYQLTVTAPEEWELIANSLEESTQPASDDRITRIYAETKPFSTYLFALIAGPYHAFRDDHNGTPIGLFCRKSMAQYLDTEELFTITKKGLDFFEEFFDYPYAFGKYDQIFVPEFNHGAMENVGAVTFNESMVYRDPPTENQRRRRAEVILHEMAHMWFGNLVTMQWWNDLWLNESFATFMSYLSMEQATRFQSGWQDFNASIKNWAMTQDQLITTHPIAGKVRDTDETFLNFDGITYGKGASVLKQLVATIGLNGFKEGMRQYFRTYAYKNATLNNFLESLEQGSGQQLREWSKLWLETSSLNTISAQWDASKTNFTEIELIQTAPENYPTIRPHTLEVALVNPINNVISSIQAVLTEQQTKIPIEINHPKPSLVFPNYNDHGYAKISLDQDSINFVKANLETITDSLLRQQLWSSLWNMVRDQQLSSVDFLGLVRTKIAMESNTELVDAVLGHASAALGRYVPAEWREREAHLMFESAKDSLQKVTSTDEKIIWGRATIGFAISQEDIEWLGKLADSKETIPNFQLDQDMRWAIATKYVAFNFEEAHLRVEKELEEDPTDRGKRAQLRCETAVPDSTIKEIAWERFIGEGYGSRYLNQAAMSGFNWTHQRELLESYVGRFFEQVPKVFQERDREFATVFYSGLYPAYIVDQDILERSQELLNKTTADQTVLQRMLRESIDTLDRAINCQQYARTQM